MILKKKFDIVNNDNIVLLNKSDILRNSISSKDLKLILDKINSGFKILNADILNLFYFIMNNKLQNDFEKGNFVSDDIIFINDENLELPAYYDITEKKFICNFLKPVYYLDANDIIAHILYSFVYKFQFKLKTINRNMINYIGDIFSTVFLYNFGNKEGLLSDLKSLVYLRLITYKYLFKLILNKNVKLIDLIYLIQKKLLNTVDINKIEIENIDKIIDVSDIKKYLISLSKVDLSPNTDSKSFVSVLYRKYNINPVIMFESVDRILPFLVTLNFNNIINNNFSNIVRSDINEKINIYVKSIIMNNIKKNS